MSYGVAVIVVVVVGEVVMEKMMFRWSCASEVIGLSEFLESLVGARVLQQVLSLGGTLDMAMRVDDCE